MTHRLPPEPRRTVDLDPDEALRLLSSVPLGRIVFPTDFPQWALPAVRPVSHILDDGDIIVCARNGAVLTAPMEQADSQGVAVAYQADEIDHNTGLRWSVVATGHCHLVTDPEQVARYRAALRSQSDHGPDHVVRIRPDLVTGIRRAVSD
ncbi:pyridoxamine 5'-phosphate oxidase family protein [Streptomyces sp. RY43-2]|uniref:Pyridoxamine 5'-phosphate oxidase family protein n=1 Tax=Streptomyces macrolidinus TaxID=2952607 RepID=A0ABT0ZJS5_9ACTN|nr:pyridoxamine 5'-phosphate oxidase family protein [Streptomyces macrolidinus]MCN9243782.1 pyridoxamine 5'-phosphate oxidase family protein [Streptomyces macrolidinus]